MINSVNKLTLNQFGDYRLLKLGFDIPNFFLVEVAVNSFELATNQSESITEGTATAIPR
jgi:hypothetical protein